MYYNGKEYPLETRTIKIAKLIETTENSKTAVEAYQNQYNLVKAAIGHEATDELLGPVFNDVDLNQLVILYNNIIDAYDAPIVEATRQKEAEMFSSPAIMQIDKMAKNISTIMNAADKSK